ncbi:MAG TPA: DUF397 domain-containing protein [Actinoplanes sp.]|nr:DUF397 domain-containing protein [Actinoplanes sp.]
MIYWVRPVDCDTNTCIEVARGDGGGVLVRNSSAPADMIRFSDAEWCAFLADVRAGKHGNMGQI